MLHRFHLLVDFMNIIHIHNIHERPYVNAYENVRFSLNKIAFFDVDFVDEISDEAAVGDYDLHKWIQLASEEYG